MPLKKSPKGAKKATKQKVASANISEMHKSKTYAKTKKKFGKAVADRQAVAAGLHAAGMSKKKKSRKKK
jgi:hypothetical protein